MPKSPLSCCVPKNRSSPAGTDQCQDDKEGWRSGCKGGRKKHCLDLQLVVQLIIDIDDCDNQTGNTLPSSLRPSMDSNFGFSETAAAHPRSKQLGIRLREKDLGEIISNHIDSSKTRE